MKIKKKIVIEWYIFISLIMSFLIYIFFSTNYQTINILVMITFMINGIIIIVNLSIKSKKGYSLNDIFWIFMFSFMFVAPLLQYMHNSFPWWDQNLLTNKIILSTNIFILSFMVIYIIIYFLFKNKLNRYLKLKIYRFSNVKFVLNIGFFISFFISIYIILTVGFWDLFSRGTSSLELSQIKNLIIGNSLRGFPFITLIFHFIYKKKYGYFYNKLQLIIISILFFLTHFPSGLARYKIAVVYIALILVIIKKFNNKYFFKLIILGGLLIIFPLLNIFRNISITALSSQTLFIPNPIELFLRGDFDAYSMFARGLIYVKINGLTFGRQLLGAMLFFVPRAIWPTKPIGSGHMIAKSFNWTFTNLSFPFIGEGYINFGIIGIVIFAIILGYLNSRFDYNYEIKSKLNDSISILEIYYPALIGFLFFILRGDLMSSWAYTIGYFLPVLFLYLVDKFIILLKRVTI